MDDYSLAIAFQTDKKVETYGELAMTAEAYGFDVITVYNDLLYQPAWLPLMEIARHTKRARIGVAAVNPFTCHPVNIAGNISLIDEVSNGRTYLGLARGGWLELIGVHPKREVTALKEALKCIRHLLRRDTAPLDGEIFPLSGGDALRWDIERANIPMLLGSWGTKTIRNCVEYVTEIKLGGTSNPDVVPLYRQQLDDLHASDVGIVVGAVTVVDEDGEAARALARREVAMYLPVVAALDKTIEIEPQVLEGINAAASEFDYERAAGFVSDELLSRFAFAGTPADLIRQTQSLIYAGAARVEFGTPHGLKPGSGLKLLGEKVLPAFADRGEVR